MPSSLHTANTNERQIHQNLVHNWLKPKAGTIEQCFGASLNKKHPWEIADKWVERKILARPRSRLYLMVHLVNMAVFLLNQSFDFSKGKCGSLPNVNHYTFYLNFILIYQARQWNSKRKPSNPELNHSSTILFPRLIITQF